MIPRLLSAIPAAALWLAAPAAVGGPPCSLPAESCQEPDQMGHGAANVVGVTSDANANADFAVRDNFVPADTATIDTVCWYGLYVDFDAEAGCGPGTVADSFTITYYTSVAGFPPEIGAVRNGPFDVTATLAKAPTGNVVPSPLGDLAEFEFSAAHPAISVAQGECIWIEIRNDTTGSDPPCNWLWQTAPSAAEGGIGDGLSWQDDVMNDFDLAFCLNVLLALPDSCEPPINEGCLGATNRCDEASGDPGCNDAECCTLVCEELAFCCSNAWTQQCVTAASDICSECGQTGTGNCFVSNFTPFCDDECGQETCLGCCQTVCAVDPACCTSEISGWDGLCVHEAMQLCQCMQFPVNDDCADAIPVMLGDTTFDNTCGSPDGPTHDAPCLSGLSGLGVDIWFTYTADFTGDLLISTCNQAGYDTLLAVYEGCDCQALSDPPLGCNDDGAVCGGATSLLVVPVKAGTCYTIRIGSDTPSQGSGTLTLSNVVPPECSVDIPPEAIPEGELCGADTNGGCNNDGAPTFSRVTEGDVIHGSAWAVGLDRDTDWYELVLDEPALVTLTVEAEFPFLVGFAETDPPGSGDCAEHTDQILPFASGDTCTEASVSAQLEAGTWWPYVAPTITDGLPCPAGISAANDYVLTVDALPPCPWDCQADGPDGNVGISDFLDLLLQWQMVGTSCDLGLGAEGAGIEEFLDLLLNWGPCP